MPDQVGHDNSVFQRLRSLDDAGASSDDEVHVLSPLGDVIAVKGSLEDVQSRLRSLDDAGASSDDDWQTQKTRFYK